MADIGRRLYENCIRGKWDEVVDMYKKDKGAHTAILPKSENTALHVAVKDGKEGVVSQLVKLVKEPTPEALRIQNKRLNTPLHSAVSNGTVKMIEDIADADPSLSLVSARNVDGETPLFLAALHGRKKAFMTLHYTCHKDPSIPINYSNCKGNDGNTILHCAIAGDNLDLTFQILHLYGDLVNSKNEKGASPLHLLASRPSAFRSGSHLGRFETFIYDHCISVKELKVEPSYQQLPTTTDQSRTQGEDPEALENTLANGVETNSSGITIFKKIRQEKEKHVWSVQIMNELLEQANFMYEYDRSGSKPDLNAQDQATPYSAYNEDKTDESSENGKEKETLVLVAAKNGVAEMIEKILQLFPLAVHDLDANKKNIVLLAAENRHPHLYNLLLKKKKETESLFWRMDDKGNSALHLAAKFAGGEYIKSWLIPSAVLLMHWEIKWFLFVEESMPPHLLHRCNKNNKTPRMIFTETHEKLIKSGEEWLNQTSESCSVVAALIATVAFATSTTVPGGVHEETGIPTLGAAPAFKVFAISSLIALCCSVSSVALFLSIRGSRYHEHDFAKNLPRKLILGLASMFVSVISMLVCFCSSHFLLVFKNKYRFAAFSLYAVICLPVTFFTLAHIPLYLDLMWSTFKKKYHSIATKALYFACDMCSEPELW